MFRLCLLNSLRTLYVQLHHLVLSSTRLLGSCLLCWRRGLGLFLFWLGLHGIDLLLGDLDFAYLVVAAQHSHGGVDKSEDALGEIEGILDDEASVDESSVVESADQLSGVLVGLFLS